MHDKSTRVISNTQVQSEAAIPLYATMSKDGQFTLLDVQDMPCYTLTQSGQEEVAANHHTHEWLDDALKRKGIDTAWMDSI